MSRTSRADDIKDLDPSAPDAVSRWETRGSSSSTLSPPRPGPVWTCRRTGQPSLSIDDMATALAAGLSAIVGYTGKDDERTVGGALH